MATITNTIKIYFNSLGVVTSTDYSDVALRQGSVGITLKAFFDEIDNALYTATLNFTRSDGTSSSGLIMQIDSSNEELYKYKFNDPWFFAKAGTTTMTIYLRDASGNVIAQGQVTFSIEATDYDAEPLITISQYTELLTALTGKQDALLPESLNLSSLIYVIGFDENGHLKKGAGSGAIYSGGTGISVSNFVIAIDDSVVATKTFLSETYLSKSEASSIYETITHASTTYATKTELQTLKNNAFIKVNTTTYATLAAFLLSTGEEGYIYLYPIDTTDLTKGYYQYIWEDNAWMGIGTTRIDLTNYASLDGNNTFAGNNTHNGTETFNGVLNPNANGKGLTLPDTTNFTANKELATNDNIQSIKTQSTGGATSIQLKTWVGTQTQYDSILTKDANTQYIII